MPVKGQVIKYDEIGKLFGTIPFDDLVVTEKFLNGDHWQSGDGWVGWKPETASVTAESDWRIIQSGFTPKNVIKGMVWRLRGAVLGKEPDWEIVPADRPEQAPVLDPLNPVKPTLSPDEKKWKERDEILTKWWSEKRIHSVLKDFITHYAAYGKASVYIYIPKGYVNLNADGKTAQLKITNKSDLAEVLSKIYVSAPKFAGITDADDDDFGEKFVVLKLKKQAETDTDTYEVHYVDENKKTHIRQLTQASTVNERNTDTDLSVDLGGNLLTFITGAYETAMISVPVKQQQKTLNHAKTMEGYAIANINFPETVFINAALPTDSKKGPDGTMVETAKPLWRGVGRFLNLVGLSTTRGDGGEDLTTPDVKYRQGADPEKFAKVAENNTRDMHQEAGMVYILLSSSPYPSGESRIESMTDYLILLVDYKTLVDTLGVWLLTTVLRLAFNFTDNTAENNKFAVVFSTKLTLGRVSTEDKRVMLDEVNANLRSRRNYMVTTEVTDDPSMEMNVIAAEPKPLPPAPAETDPNKPKPKPAPDNAS